MSYNFEYIEKYIPYFENMFSAYPKLSYQFWFNLFNMLGNDNISIYDHKEINKKINNIINSKFIEEFMNSINIDNYNNITIYSRFVYHKLTISLWINISIKNIRDLTIKFLKLKNQFNKLIDNGFIGDEYIIEELQYTIPRLSISDDCKVLLNLLYNSVTYTTDSGENYLYYVLDPIIFNTTSIYENIFSYNSEFFVFDTDVNKFITVVNKIEDYTSESYTFHNYNNITELVKLIMSYYKSMYTNMFVVNYALFYEELINNYILVIKDNIKIYRKILSTCNLSKPNSINNKILLIFKLVTDSMKDFINNSKISIFTFDQINDYLFDETLINIYNN